HERAAELGGSRDDALGVPDVRRQKVLVPSLVRLERPLERLPEVAPADRRREPADGEQPPRPSARDVRHHPSRCRIRIAAAAAPKPLSTFTTTRPAAQEFSMASSAASPPKLVP